MRTTLVIDDGLFVSVKKLAAEKGASVSAVVCEALRGLVYGQDHLEEPSVFHMPTFGSGSSRLVDSQPGDFHQLEHEGELASFQK